MRVQAFPRVPQPRQRRPNPITSPGRESAAGCSLNELVFNDRILCFITASSFCMIFLLMLIISFFKLNYNFRPIGLPCMENFPRYLLLQPVIN